MNIHFTKYIRYNCLKSYQLYINGNENDYF